MLPFNPQPMTDLFNVPDKNSELRNTRSSSSLGEMNMFTLISDFWFGLKIALKICLPDHKATGL